MRRPVTRILGVGSGLVLAGLAVRRVVDRPDPFYASAGDAMVDQVVGPNTIHLPVTYHRSEQVISLHAIAVEPLRDLLPSDALHPVRIPDGRALLALSAARYLEGTAPGVDPAELPYGEMMAAALVTPDPALPLRSILRSLLPGSAPPPYGALLLHVAMTNRGAVDLARDLGYPAFVADFAFEDDPAERHVRVSEDGREILQLTVASRGRVSTDRHPMRIYSVKGDELLEALVPCSGLAQQGVGPRSGLLALGDHPVAERLRALQPSARPLMTRSYLNLRMLISPPRVVGAARPYGGYLGQDRPTGDYSIRYPDGSCIDLRRTSIRPPVRASTST